MSLKRNKPRKNYTLSIETLAKIDLIAKVLELKNSQVIEFCVDYTFNNFALIDNLEKEVFEHENNMQ